MLGEVIRSGRTHSGAAGVVLFPPLPLETGGLLRKAGELNRVEAFY